MRLKPISLCPVDPCPLEYFAHGTGLHGVRSDSSDVGGVWTCLEGLRFAPRIPAKRSVWVLEGQPYASSENPRCHPMRAFQSLRCLWRPSSRSGFLFVAWP